MKRGTASPVAKDRGVRTATTRSGPGVRKGRAERFEEQRAEQRGGQAEALRELRLAMLHRDAQTVCGHARTLQALIGEASEGCGRAHALAVERAARQRDFQLARVACDRLEEALARQASGTGPLRTTGS